MRKLSFIFLIFLGSMSLISWNSGGDSSMIARHIQKKMRKEITAVFDAEQFTLDAKALVIKKHPFLIDHTLFQIKNNEEALGYAFLGTAPSKTDSFEYLLLFDTDLNLKKAKVLIYREDYGGEIANKRWLSQFISHPKDSPFVYGESISAISGATISVQSMTQSLNYVLENLRTYKTQDLL